MTRRALTGIGLAIKANTTEKSIDDLRAEGKHRVRVVRGDRVMEIIQAVVDDAIAAEVGEIAQRDRDRIVSETQERFSRVLRMQQDLEHDATELRGALRGAESERERLRADKAHLEAQLEIARRVGGDAETAARLVRDVARVRESVERMALAADAPPVAIALARAAEQQAARDTEATRRVCAEFDEMRDRIESFSRNAAAARDTAIVAVLEQVRLDRALADAPVVARLDRGLDAMSGRIAALSATLEDASRNLRGEIAALSERAPVRDEAPAADVVGDALADLRAQSADAAARTARAHEALAVRVDGSLSELRRELAALAARAAESAAQQQESVRALGDRMARGATADADAVQTSFNAALDRALDQITKTLKAATARPIETSVEATDVLLAKIFDDPDSVLTSNLDQLEVSQRRSAGSITRNIARLKEMGEPKRPAADQRA